MPSKEKVFGLGLSRTGQSSLGHALRILKYNHYGSNYHAFLRAKCGDMSLMKKIVDNYESFEHHPYPYFYKELDQLYPNSKFILTTRITPEKWLNSLQHTDEALTPDLHLWINLLVYGYTKITDQNRKHFIDYYNKHNQTIRDYFKHREKDFLEVCWEKGDGWEEICNFLSKKEPGINFPHAARKINSTNKEELNPKEKPDGKLQSYDINKVIFKTTDGRRGTFNLKKWNASVP